MRFTAGKLVICIGNGEDYLSLLNLRPDICPKLGSVYTVQQVLPRCESCGDRHLDLEEVHFLHGYPSSWFRPCREANFDLFIARLFGGPLQERPFT